MSGRIRFRGSCIKYIVLNSYDSNGLNFLYYSSNIFWDSSLPSLHKLISVSSLFEKPVHTLELLFKQMNHLVGIKDKVIYVLYQSPASMDPIHIHFSMCHRCPGVVFSYLSSTWRMPPLLQYRINLDITN